MEYCKNRAVNNPGFIGVEKRLADGRRAMNTTHIMNLRIGFGRSDRYEKQKARNTSRTIHGCVLSKVSPHRCLNAADTEKYGVALSSLFILSRRDIHEG